MYVISHVLLLHCYFGHRILYILIIHLYLNVKCKILIFRYKGTGRYTVGKDINSASTGEFTIYAMYVSVHHVSVWDAVW